MSEEHLCETEGARLEAHVDLPFDPVPGLHDRPLAGFYKQWIEQEDEKLMSLNFSELRQKHPMDKDTIRDLQKHTLLAGTEEDTLAASLDDILGWCRDVRQKTYKIQHAVERFQTELREHGPKAVARSLPAEPEDEADIKIECFVTHRAKCYEGDPAHDAVYDCCDTSCDCGDDSCDCTDAADCQCCTEVSDASCDCQCPCECSWDPDGKHDKPKYAKDAQTARRMIFDQWRNLAGLKDE